MLQVTSKEKMEKHGYIWIYSMISWMYRRKWNDQAKSSCNVHGTKGQKKLHPASLAQFVVPFHTSENKNKNKSLGASEML